MAIIDKTGKKFGRLIVVCEATRDDHNRVRWVCSCDCGKETIVRSLALIEKGGGTQSCGCLQREKAAATGQSTKKDRVGERIGRLTIVSEAPRNKQSRPSWICKCDCGNEVTRSGGDLYHGGSASCGCLRRETSAAIGAATVRHGHSGSNPDGTRAISREYKSYMSMKQRCGNPNAPNYHLYGGRGISICDRWLGEKGFEAFLSDMGARPQRSSLDREDNNGNYEPGNCRWATATEQSNNRRDTPEYDAIRKKTLDAGRRKMWSDPEIRARLLKSRRKTKQTM